MNCPSCGNPVPDDARFCPNCGHLLVHTEERRIVTVLFADLVGFTGQAENMDPERVKHLIDLTFERLVADITAFGGTVDKIIGDAIVALFGAPIAHEDDPERAVRAALRMQRSMAEVTSEWPTEARIRIGITTGEVLTGAVTAAGDYTAMGDTVNLASRLQGLARAGEILVGEFTHDVTRSVIRYEERGLVGVRGREGEVRIWAALDEAAPPGRRRRDERTPLVGRNIEHLQLTTAVDTSVARRRAHLLLVLGEAGIGKTRLVGEVAAAAESTHGAMVLEGRVVPYGETNPYRAIADALSGSCGLERFDTRAVALERLGGLVRGVVPDDQEELVERMTTSLLHVLGYETPIRSLPPEREREEIAYGLGEFLAACSDSSPVVLVLSDINWADQPLLTLLESLLARLSGRPFVVLATARWTAEDERWVVPPGRHNTVVLNLDPLSLMASGRLVRAFLGVDVSDELVEILYERSGGNPFFLEELATLLREAGLVGAGARIDVIDQLGELPDTLRGLVAARLDALTADERAMVEDASVIGRRGPVYSLLLMAERQSRPGAEKTFARLVDKDIFATTDEGWVFRSELVRDVAYSMLTKTVRARSHIAIGEWMAAKFEADSGAANPGVIARHFYSAAVLTPDIGGSPGAGTELVDTALQWLETAADWAERSHSNYAAGRFHAQRLELLTEDDPRRIAAHLGRARARLGLRELAGALYDAREALAEALRVGDAVSEAHSLNLLGDIATAESDHIRALDVLTRAVKRWRELGQWGGLAEALRLRGMAAMGMGDREAAEADFEKALDIFVELEDSSGEAWCQQNLAWLSFELGHIADAEARLDRAVQLFARNSDAGGLGWALGLAAFVRFHLGDSEEAESIAQLVLTEARKRGDRFGEAMMNLLLASITLWSGRCQEAVDLAEQALQIFRDTGQKYGEVQSLGTLARAKAAVGRMSESRRLLTECMEAATEIPGEPLKAFSHMVAGATAVQSGDPETSLAMLDRSQADREPDLDMRILGSMDRWVTRSMAYLQLGRVADARAVLAAIEEGGPEKKGPYFQTVSAMVELLEGDTAAAMARATGTLDTGRATYLDRRTALLVIALSHTRNGDEEQAITAFDAALAAVDSTDSRLSQTLVRIARAIAYRALDRPDADAREAEAEAASDALGVGVEGWRRLYCEAVGVEPRPVRVGPGPIRSD